MTALDFSYARPGGAALNAASVDSVGRYLGTDNRCITKPELDDYLNHGVSVWFIKENSSRGMLNGYSQGLSDARDAQNELNTLGHPTAAVYFTADFDIQPYQFATGNAYLQGAATVIPVARLGLYAGNDYLNYAGGLVTYRWKTASTSYDHGQTATELVHLVQTLDAVPIPDTDNDIILIPNHGQISNTTTADNGQTPITGDDMSAQSEQQIAEIHAALFNGTPAHLDVGKFDQVLNAVTDMQARLMAATGGGWDTYDETIKTLRYLKAQIKP